MRCNTARASMVAAVDGRLSERYRHALDRHLAACARCRAEQVSTEDVLGMLRRLPSEADVPARLEQEVLRRVRLLAADEAERGVARRLFDRLRLSLPAVATAAAALLAVLAVRESIDTTPVRSTPAPAVRRGVAIAHRAKAPAEPPAELAARPELFIDLPMLRDFDKLQHFESIAAMSADEPPNGSHAPPPSNG